MVSSIPVSANRLVRGLSAAILGLASLGIGVGQELPTLTSALPAEAPTSLFSAGVNEGELTAVGSWQLSFISSVSFFSPAGGGLQVGQIQPLLMTQTPDLLLDFNLFDRWYAEARVSPDPGSTRYAMGYRGAPGETLEDVRIGNSGVGFPDLPFVTLGEGGAYSFGALVKAGGGNFQTQALLRYDQADRVHRTFAGSREISEATASASDFIRGRWFLMPAVESDLQVFVQSAVGTLSAGDGTTWRKLGNDEYSLEEGGTVVALDAAATTRVALSWSAIPVGTILIGGTRAEIAFDPAAAPFGTSGAGTGPIEVLSHYALPPTSGDIFVRDNASGKKLSGYVVLAKDDGSVEVRDSAGTSVDARPFLAEEPTLYSRVPGATTTTIPDLNEFEIVSQSFAANDGISIDADTIDASIEVLRNGIPDTAFTVDKTKNLLVLLRPPEASEIIDVSYLRETSDRKSGSLSGGVIGTYSKDDLSAWGAVTGNLGLPGQGYADSGQDSPAWAQLALGSAKSKGALTWNVGLAGRMEYSEISGRYLIDGMDNSGIAPTSYWPSDGTLPTGFSCAQVDASSYKAAWPDLSAILDAGNSTAEMLEISTDQTAPIGFTGAADFKRIVDSPPLSSFGTFTFFARSSSATAGNLSGARLTIVLDDGQAGDTALSVTVPLGDLSAGWTRVRYRYTSGTVSTTTGESGSESIDYLATGAWNALVTTASRITISVSGLQPGCVVDIDDILLENPVGTASLDLSGTWRYQDTGISLGPSAFPIVKGVDANLTVSAGLSGQSWGYSDFGVRSSLGPFDLDVGLGLDDAGSGPAAAGRHEVTFAPPWSPIHVSDSFAPATGSDGYSKDDKVSVLLGPLGSLDAEASSVFSDNPLSSDPGLLQRSWKATFGDRSFFSAHAEADESSLSTGRLSNYDGSYFDLWYATFSDFTPFAIGTATERTLSSEVDLLPLFGTPLLSGKLAFDGSGLGAGDRGVSLDLHMEGRLSLPGDISFSPFYDRTWTARREGIDADLVSFGSSGLDDLARTVLPWNSIPFAELWSPGTSAGFSDFALDGIHYSSSYVPQVGVKFQSEPGISPWELVIPQEVDCSYSRKLSSDGFTVLDTDQLALAVDFGALELFGSQGAMPIFTRYANDEYRLGVSSTVDVLSASSVDAWTLSEDGMASLLGDRAMTSDRLVASEKFGIDSEPSGMTWNLQGGLDLAHVIPRSWILSLFDFAIGGASGAIAGLPSGFDSQWIKSIAGARPIARRTLSFGFSADSATGDNPAAYPSLSFDESLESRISIPDRLEAWSDLKFDQTLDSTGMLTLTFETSIGLTFSF